MSHLWKKVQDEMVDEKTFTKKHKHYFCSQSKISRFHTSFTKFLGMSWASVISNKLLLL